MANSKKSHRNLRAFCSAFMLTLCLLILGSGLLVAEYNTRRTAFGQTRIRMEYVYEDGKLHLYTPATEKEYQLPQTAQAMVGRAWTLLPARVRVAAWATEAQQAAAPYILHWLFGVGEGWG